MVSVQYAESYDDRLMEKAVAAHFAALDIPRLLKPGMRVVLKPNLLMKRRPDAGTTTHPALVAAIIRALRKHGVEEITIADSPGGPYTAPLLAGIYKASGMEEAAKTAGAKLNFDLGTVEMRCPNPAVSPSFPIIKPVAEADLLISVCKLKTHCMAGLSGGVKNLFGCIPGLTKPDYHWRYPKEEDFCNMLVDLCETVRPAITFCDAVVSMEGDGPSSGTLRQTGMVLCADSPYELDVALCQAIGRSDGEILTIKKARERGICVKRFADLEIAGGPLKCFPDFKKPRTVSTDFITGAPGFLQPLLRPIVRRFLTARPKVDLKRCVGCGKCAESCPAHTIGITGGKARIGDKACIRCYCCHEMCPIGAISVEQNRLLRL